MNDKKLFAVIGDPVGHSLSPAMHNAAFRELGLNAEYIAVKVIASDLEEFAAAARKNLAGFNVTVPHKNAIIPFLDELSESALLAGSVNTVSVTKDGRLKGTTTDGIGIERALQESFNFSLNSKRITFIGCGGVVNALAWHFAMKNVAKINIINRTIAKADILADAIKKHYPLCNIETCVISDTESCRTMLHSSDVAIQCTSMGLSENDPPPLDPAIFPESIFYFDTIYKPTALLKALSIRGIQCAGGSGMLLHQGAEAFEIWTGFNPPIEVMRKTLS